MVLSRQVSSVRRLVTVAAVVLLLAGAAAAGWFWYGNARPDALLARGRGAAREGDWAGAEDAADRLAARGHPDHAHLLLGETLLLRKRHAEALDEFNQIRDEGSLRLEAAALSGQCLLRLGSLREAERAFSFVTSERPDHADAWRGLAAVYFDQGALPLALSCLEKVVELDPRDARPWRLMGLIHKDLGDHAEATACYDEALGRPPADFNPDQVRKELADCLVKSKDYERALRVIDTQLAPRERAAAAALRAQALHGLGREDEARAALDAGLKASPDDASLLKLRSQIYLEAGEARPAVALLLRALARDRHDLAGRYQLFLAYEALGLRKEAEEQRRRHGESEKATEELARLNREVAKDPWDAATLLRLADHCEGMGRAGEAAMWRRAAAAARAGAKGP